jgi:hypothetical protein
MPGQRMFLSPARTKKEIEELYGRLRSQEAKLVGPDGRTDVLPNNVNSLSVSLVS